MAGRWHPSRLVAFLGLGLALYLGLLAGADWLCRRNGDRNPFFRIAAHEGADPGWIVLGASHAMPLDMGGMGAEVEAAAGSRVLNLAATGAGPFLWGLVARRWFAGHGAGGVLVVADAFAFADRRWNEDRVGDADLLPRVPLDRRTLAVLAAARPRLPAATLADYATGFSKINDRRRLEPDRWEAEARFDARPRPSDAADRARIDYLYPAGGAIQGRYLDDLAALARLARGRGARVVVIRPPLPDRFRRLLPGEDAFDAALRARMAAEGVAVVDHSALLPGPASYFDSDHLNRAGVRAWIAGGLGAVLAGDGVDAGQ